MDETLVGRVQKGDRAAFEALIVEHHRRLFVLAHGILRDRHAAEDATQQAFIDIWHDIGQLRDGARFEAWSYRLLVRVCHREARKRRILSDAVQPLDMDVPSTLVPPRSGRRPGPPRARVRAPVGRPANRRGHALPAGHGARAHRLADVGPDGTVWIIGGSVEGRHADRIHFVPGTGPTAGS